MIFGYLTSTEAGDDLKEKKNSGIEWIGEIPVDWKTIKSKYCISISNGSDPKTEGSTPVYGSGAESFKTCGEYKIGPAVLLGRKGATLHIPHYVEGNYWNVDTAFDATPFCGNINLKFYYYCACVFDYAGYISQTTLPGMTQTNYKNMSIPFPQLEVQERIANFLDEKCSQIDSIITRQQEVIEKLKAYKLSVITETVTKGLNPDAPMKDSGVEWIGEIPEHWTMLKLKYASSILRGKFNHRPRNDPAYYDGNHPFVQTGDVARANKYIKNYSQTLNEKGYAVSKEFPANSVCMTIAANVGDVAILTFDACFPDSVVGFVPSDNIAWNYLYYVLTAMKKQFVRNAIISTQLNLNIEIIKEEFIPVAPLHIQEQISKFLDDKSLAIDRTISAKQCVIDKLTDYKKSLIYEVVTGKREV